MNLHITCRHHNASLTLREETIPPGGNADWRVSQEHLDGDCLLTLGRLGPSLESVSLALRVEFDDWSTDHYVLLPGAAYNGNRFPVRDIPYPPIPLDPADLGPGTPTLITDIPRLNHGPGPSSLVQLTRDCTTPMAAVWDPHHKSALFLLCPPHSRFGDYGLELDESDDRSRAVLSLRAPGIRPGTRYSFCSTTREPSPDRGIAIPTGLNVTLRHRLLQEPCGNLRAFFARVYDLRRDMAGETAWRHETPFSEAFRILEEKYNRENWNEREGYYRVGCYDIPELRQKSQDWQTGWVGGLQSTLPLLALGGPETRARVLRTLDFACTRLPAPSGLFHGGWSEGAPWGDHFRDTSLPWVMTRKCGDALYFLLKHFDLLRLQDPAWTLPATWERATRGLADALATVWERHGQLGQFLNLDTGGIEVGGSAAGGIVPGALTLASAFFDAPRYLRVAEAAAAHLVASQAECGHTTGGPGEILQCPDSESAFGLLESLVVLAEHTRSPRWIADAEFLAHHAATWCVSHDYPFPPESEFGRLGLKSLGSVWASVQNKHSAPGICTFSGDSLLRLYRLTGDERHLELLADTAHNITQYLSRADKPIRGFDIRSVGDYTSMKPMPPGWMSERVQLSDFSEPSGEIFAGSCWCEASCLLTASEIPSLYVRPDLGLVQAFDHVEVDILDADPETFTLSVSNPCGVPLTLRVLAERGTDLSAPLPLNALHRGIAHRLAPGERIVLQPL